MHYEQRLHGSTTDVWERTCAGGAQQSSDVGGAQGQKSPAGHSAVLQLLQTIGEAYSLLSKYHCQVRASPYF